MKNESGLSERKQKAELYLARKIHEAKNFSELYDIYDSIKEGYQFLKLEQTTPLQILKLGHADTWSRVIDMVQSKAMEFAKTNLDPKDITLYQDIFSQSTGRITNKNNFKTEFTKLLTNKPVMSQNKI